MSALDDVKVGDDVMVVVSGWGSDQERIVVRKAVKVSAHHITLTDSSTKWKKSTGGAVNASKWDRVYIAAYDEKRCADAKHAHELFRMRNQLSRIAWGKVPETMLRSAHDMLIPKETK